MPSVPRGGPASGAFPPPMKCPTEQSSRRSLPSPALPACIDTRDLAVEATSQRGRQRGSEGGEDARRQQPLTSMKPKKSPPLSHDVRGGTDSVGVNSEEPVEAWRR